MAGSMLLALLLLLLMLLRFSDDGFVKQRGSRLSKRVLNTERQSWFKQ